MKTLSSKDTKFNHDEYYDLRRLGLFCSSSYMPLLNSVSSMLTPGSQQNADAVPGLTRAQRTWVGIHRGAELHAVVAGLNWVPSSAALNHTATRVPALKAPQTKMKTTLIDPLL
ncbi:hypothetical protein ACJZ2D_005555 [Fusarium nematophilum]